MENGERYLKQICLNMPLRILLVATAPWTQSLKLKRVASLDLASSSSSSAFRLVPPNPCTQWLPQGQWNSVCSSKAPLEGSPSERQELFTQPTTGLVVGHGFWTSLTARWIQSHASVNSGSLALRFGIDKIDLLMLHRIIGCPPKVSNKTKIEACAMGKWSTTIDPTYPFVLLPLALPHFHLLSYEAGGEETNKACCTTLARNLCTL